MEEGGFATQVYHRDGATLTVTGIPAVRVRTRCNDAVLEWGVAQEVQDLMKALRTARLSAPAKRPSWANWCLNWRQGPVPFSPSLDLDSRGRRRFP